MIIDNNDTQAPAAAPRSYFLIAKGACLGNPGPGGWSVIVQLREADTIVRQYAIAGSSPEITSNNKMALQAAAEGLRSLSEPGVFAKVISDSQHVVKGMTEWMPGWKTRGWRTSDKKPVSNLDLWQALEGLACARPVRWEWVRGHALNETADMLAKNAAAGVYVDNPEAFRAMHPELFA